MSLKKERMLENGQIKIFTEAIDSYYNSTSDSQSSTSTTFPSTGYINSDTVNDIEMSSTTEYSSRNQVTRISENSISTDKNDCRVKKTWNSNVGKKILAVHFSPMNIKSEFLSTQTMLDGFESFALYEAVHALQEIIFKQNSDVYLAARRDDLCTDPRPVDLVGSAEKSRAFRKLHLNDKIHLLKNAFFSLNSLKNLIAYDAQIDGWYFCDRIFPRKQLYLKHPDSYRKALMTLIAEVEDLQKATEVQFDDSIADASYLLKNRVVRFIELRSIQQ
uniref:Uncharacterized protein n=1 Tax=Tetranychus urticae TaxID=32264 RepID=T1KCA6_TETUR